MDGKTEKITKSELKFHFFFALDYVGAQKWAFGGFGEEGGLLEILLYRHDVTFGINSGYNT